MFPPLLCAVAAALAVPAPVFAQTRSAAPTNAQAIDSAASHAPLRRAIEKFQDRWRSTWQSAHVKRNGGFNLTAIRGIPYSTRGITEGRSAAPAGQPRAPVTEDVLSPFQGDRSAANLTANMQRYLSILCIIGSPSDAEIEARKRAFYAGAGVSATTQRPNNSLAVARLIRDPSGGTCPSWLPETKESSLDEDESIDLALPVLERRNIAQSRESLIQELARAQVRFPNDTWITGQRVRFLLDQRAIDRARDAAAACTGDSVACLELRALVDDHANDMVAAEMWYREADRLRDAMPRADSLPCIDVDALLGFPEPSRDVLVARSCADQRVFVHRLWWLADPLWSVPGNERYVALRSRQTHARLRAVLSRDERFVWSAQGGGRGMRELVIRYGWPTHTFWSGGQLEHDISTFRDVGILFVAPPYSAKEYRRDRQAFFPAFATVDAPFSAGETDWQTSLPAGKTFDEWWPSEHMRLPTYIRPVPNGQEVYLRRDTTIRLVSAVDDAASALAVGPDESWVAILLGSTGPDDIRTLQELAMHGTQTLRFDLTVPPSPLFMMSTEVLLPGRARNALRARRGVVFPQTLQEMATGSVALSTPLFLALPTDVRETPTDPDSASAFLAGTLSFSRTATLAVYWESYGFAARDTVDVRLRVVRDDDAGRIRRAGEILGVVAERRDSVSIGWREPDVRRGRVLDVASVMPVVSRGLLVNTQQLPVGVYRILLEMRRVDGATAHSEQRVILRD